MKKTITLLLFISSLYGNSESNFNQLIKITNNISSIVHELQKERGLSAGYLVNQDKFRTKLLNQREKTDEEIEKGVIQEKKINNLFSMPEINNLFILIKNKIKEIKNVRKEINNLNIDFNEEILFYSNLNQKLLEVINQLPNFVEDEALIKMLNSYYLFLTIKDEIGVERALLSSVFTSKKFVTNDKYKFYLKIIKEEKKLNEIFKRNSPLLFLNILKVNSDKKVIDKVEEYREIVLNNNGKDIFNVNSIKVFDTFTKKINIFRKVEKKYLVLINERIKELNVKEENYTNKITGESTYLNGVRYIFKDKDNKVIRASIQKGNVNKTFEVKLYNLYTKDNEKLETTIFKINENEVKLIEMYKNNYSKIGFNGNISVKLPIILIGENLYIGINNETTLEVTLNNIKNRYKKVKFNNRNLNLITKNTKIKIKTYQK